MSTTTIENTTFEKEYAAKGARLLEQFEGVRIYEQSITYENWKQNKKGMFSVVFDVPEKGIPPSVADEISSLARNYEFTREYYGNSPSVIMVRLPMDGDRGLCAFNATELERHVYGAKDPATRQILPGETVVFQTNSIGILEKSTVLAMAEILKKARILSF
jgi:hypothetical protein